MKKIRIRIVLLGLFLVILVNGVSLASDIKKADALFDKGRFQEALKEYDRVFKETTDTEKRWKAFYRICESLAHLFRYGEAAEKLISTPYPQQTPYLIRILILKAEMLRNFLRQYSYIIQRQDVVDDQKDKDVFRLTPDEIRENIRDAYKRLWELRVELVGMDIKKEWYFLDIKDIDFGMYPTLFDYLILSWTDFLLKQEASKLTEGIIKPKASLLLTEEFDRAVNLDDSTGLLVAELMGKASRFRPKGRLEATERWKIKQLLLPLKYTHLFDLKDLAEDKALYDYKDLQEYNRQAEDILLKWMEKFKTNEARAEAGYEVAVILNTEGKLAEVVRLCNDLEENFPRTYARHRAETLRLSIQIPYLSLQAKTTAPPAKKSLTITAKNLKKVYFRLYRVTPEELKKEYIKYRVKEYGSSYEQFNGWSHVFSLYYFYQDWCKEWFGSYLLRRTSYKKWSVKIQDEVDYTTITQIVSPPKLDSGIYLVFASGDESFKIGSSLISVCFLNVTDFVLIGTAGFTTRTEKAYYRFIEGKGPEKINDRGFHFYTLNAKTGKPIDGVNLDVYTYSSRTSERKSFNLRTDKGGAISLSLPVRLFPQDYNYYNIDPLAKSKNSFSYWSHNQCLSYSSPAPIELFIETDRPIYRPQDKVQAKVVVVWRTPEGFKRLNNKSVTFSAFDPNNKIFFTKDVKLNEFSSANVSFKIPGGRLLGKYILNAECKDGSFQNSTCIYFSVEEYKRPEFEIVLKPAVEAWRYNKEVKIEGKATYYFGGPVSEAPIKYRIKRHRVIPWCYRCWFGQDYLGRGEEVASGELKTDTEGNFSIPFIPIPPHQLQGNIPDISQFTVEVEGRDSGGRTIETKKSYKAGQNAIYLAIEPKKGFYLEKETIEIESRRLTINDTPAPGKGSYKVFTLADTPVKLPTTSEYHHKRYPDWIPPLDIQLKDIPNDRLVVRGKINYDKDGKCLIKFSPLPQGTYRIILKSQDKWAQNIEQSKIFVIAKSIKEKISVNADSVTLVEYDEYKIGDIARFIIGSALGGGVYHIELWTGNHLLSHQLIDGNQKVRLIEIPVTKKMKGGFSLRWFGIKEFNIHHGQITVSVPWKDKKLNVSLEPFNKELRPGEKVTWGVKVSDRKDKPLKAEVLALMYDRSLEYYITAQNPWLDTLYALRTTPVHWTYAVLEQFAKNLHITEGLLEKLLNAFRQPPKEPHLPGLRTWRTWVVEDYYLKKRKKTPIMMYEYEAIGEKKLDFPKTGIKGELEPTGLRVEEVAQKIEPRKEFADTAFFKPHIITTLKDGCAKFTFVAPEQLTSWRIKLLAFTKDIKEGILIEEAVTKKKLMVRADLPRFFREKDKGTIIAIVHNESEQFLKGELFINITENGKSINQKLKLKDNKRSFNVRPHNLVSFNWMIEIPEGVSTYKVKVAAVTDKFSDAEERELPILPSRERLIESALITLSGNETKRLKLSLKDDPTRINESMVLQIDPQLALSILNTIPFLVEYPYECVEQILNRFVPLSIVNEIYKKYPAIQSAVSKIPKRKTVTPAWEKEDPRRLITLMETPWVWQQSEGRPVSWPIIDLLDPEIVKAQKEITLNKLKAAQLANGAFPWWPGGEADPYMTLYVLSGFVEAKRYGVEVPKQMIQKALRYVNNKIPLLLKPKERELCLVSFAAYVITSYSPEEFAEAQKGWEAAKSWVVFLERYIHAMTPLGKAHLSLTYHRLGNKKRAEELLNMAMDGAREEPIAGVYWTPEKYSWIWYSDTVEKHAFFLRALQELRPKDKWIPGMVQWLLFNRKGTVWKSTKASAAAVYALLDYLNQRGVLVGDEIFKVSWGKKTYSEVVKADDWLDKPLRFQETGFDITPQMSQATIEKKGPGIAFAAMTWVYSTDQIPEASSPGMLELERKFYRRVKEKDTYHLKPIKSGSQVSVGDQIEVQLKINTRSQFEYMHLKDPKAAGFEPETLLSGWRYDLLRFYEEPRDSLTNFFISWLPAGEYILRYRLRPTKPGIYRISTATLQSMYAPEMTAHSAGFIIKVTDE